MVKAQGQTRSGDAVAQGDHQAQPDAAEVLSAHLARVTYHDLPPQVVSAAKACVLDTLGCLLAGTSCEDVVTIREMVAGWGGCASSTVFGKRGLKVPAASAVFANGAAIHQYDFDDVHDKAPCHPTSTSLVPALATAEAIGGVAGRELLTAVSLGNDVTVRVSMAVIGRIHDYPWFIAPVVGLFGATAAAAKILGASAEQHLNAFGLALPQTAGTWASLHHGGSSVRSIRDGLAYRNGVLAAEMAMKGIRGDKGVFDGPYGLYRAFYRGEYRREALVGELGERYETARVSLKPWPSIRHLHTTLTAVLDLMARHDLYFEDIEQVILNVGEVNLDRCRPVALGSVPENHIDLLGNMHFAVAAAIRHRNVPLELYRNTAMADDVITQAMPKVTWRYDETLNGPWTFEAGRVEIVTANGDHYKGECALALGNPDNPMTLAQMQEKFVACAAAAAQPLDRGRALEIAEMVMHLDEVDDVARLTRLLA
jgi:2-methylcitrate dehydratase PrpD